MARPLRGAERRAGRRNRAGARRRLPPWRPAGVRDLPAHRAPLRFLGEVSPFTFVWGRTNGKWGNADVRHTVPGCSSGPPLRSAF